MESTQATPKLSEDKVKQCVDARLGGEYPPKAVAKVIAELHRPLANLTALLSELPLLTALFLSETVNLDICDCLKLNSMICRIFFEV